MFLPSNITLQFGDSGDFVAELQRRLVAVGSHPEAAVTGFYDGVTVSSVTSFQARSGLRGDGVAGPETLRRLNGVMSGDTSTAEEKKEETLTPQYSAAQALDMLPQENVFGSYVPPTAEPEPLAAATNAASAHTGQPYTPHTPHVPTVQEQYTHATAHAAAHTQYPAQNTAGDMLAQMLLQATQLPAQPTPAAPTHVAPVPPQYAAAPEQHMQIPAARPAPEQHAPQSQDHTAVAAQEAAPKGIVGRALQKMDALVQKMASYFEQKLPPDVLREVQDIGKVMAQSGVKEVAIPTGPEPERTLSTPARGPEQQQAAQRG